MGAELVLHAPERGFINTQRFEILTARNAAGLDGAGGASCGREGGEGAVEAESQGRFGHDFGLLSFALWPTHPKRARSANRLWRK